MKNLFAASLAGVAFVALTLSAAAQAPVISVEPVSQTNTVGDSVTFNVTATGDAPLIYQWQKDGEDISGATDSSYTINPVLTGDAANSPGYTVIITNSSGSITSAVAILTVYPADQTITFGTLANKTYGEAAFGVSATASSGLAVTFSIFSGPATIIGGTNVSITGAGTVVVRASQGGDADYNAAPDVDQSFTVAKAPLTVTAQNESKTYGATNPTFTASLSGFVNGETDSVVSGSASFSTSATTNSPVAGSPYAITPSVGTLTASNYDFTSFVDGNLTVAPAMLVVTADNTNRVYGANNPAFTASYSGFVNSEDESILSGSPNLTTTADSSSGAGNYTIVAAAGTLAASNYSFDFVNGTLVVAKAPLTVTADNTSRSYGSPNPSFTATYTGFVNGDTESLVSGTPVFSTSATTNSAVAGSPYVITPSLGTLSADNYDFTAFVNGNLTVTPASLTVTAENKSKTYGAANPVLTAVYDGFVNGEDAGALTGTPDLTTSASTNSTVAGSPYPITASVGTLSAANYAFNFVSGNLSVTPAILTVTADSTNRVYGANNPTFTASYSGFMNGEDASVLSGSPSLTAAADSTSAVGNYIITAAVGTLTADNYTFNFVDGTLAITKLELTVTADNKARTYGAANPVFTATFSGFVNGDTESVVSGAPSFSTVATSNSPVTGSPYPITPSVGTLAADNYDFTTFIDGTLTVTPAMLTVTANDTNRVYGANNPTFTANYSGFVNGEDANVLSGSASLTTTADSTSAAGNHTITAAIGTLAAPNYTFNFVDGVLAITKLGLTVTADPKSKTYGESNPVFTASFSGFVNGDTESVISGAPSLSTSATTNSGVTGSPYPILVSLGTLSAANYEFTTFVDDELTVIPATLTVMANDTNRVYGASNPTFTASYLGFVNGEGTSVLTGSPSLTTTADWTSAVGNHTITATPGTLASDNYTFVFVDGTLAITPATLTVTADSTNRVYGASNPAFSASYSGFLNGDDESVLSGSPGLATIADSSSAAGNYPITASVGTLSADNYAFSFADGTLTVTKAPLTVTADNKTRGYGAVNPTFTASYSGFVNGDTEFVISGNASFATIATTNSSVARSPYAITPSLGTLSAANYDFTTFIDGNLTVTAATLTVTADNKSKTYGDVNPALTASYSGFVNNEDATVLTGSPGLSTSATTNSSVAGSPYTIATSIGSLVSDNYDFVFVDGALTVTPAVLTTTADDTNRVYGAANPAFTASFSGFVNGEDASVISGAPAFSTVATTNSPVPGNPYVVTPSLGTLSAANYSFLTFVDGTLTVTPALLTVTADDQSRSYGDTNPVFTASYSGFVNGEDESVLSGSPDLSTSADTNSPIAGSPYTISASIGTLSTDNYTFTFVDGLLSVTPATITVTVNDTNRIYGASNPAFTASYIGFLNGDDESDLTGSPSLTTTADSTSAVGIYPITAALGTLSLDNYEFIFVDGSMAVTKAPLIVTADPKSRSYGETNPVFTASYSGFVNGDTEAVLGGSPALSTSATTNSGVAGSPYSITVSIGTLTAANYDFVAFVDDELTVNPAPLTITANNTNRVYGMGNPVFTASYTGFVNGEDTSVLIGSPSLMTLANAASGAGNYVITAATGTLASENYAFNFVNGILAVTKATLTVTANDESRTYGAPNPAFTATYSGFVNGDTESVISGAPSFATSATANSSVAGSPYSITPSLGTLSASNYDFTTFVNGSLAVTPAPLIVTADNKSRAYGAANPVLTASYSGFVNGENESVLSGSPNLSTLADTNSTVAGGPYIIAVTSGSLAASNYSFVSFVDGLLSVTTTALTITSDSTNRLYGVSNPIFTGSIVGLQNGDDISVSYSVSATETSPVGSYPIAQTLSDPGGKLPNYAVTTNNGTLTVGGAILTITSDSTNRVYGAANPIFTGSIVGLENGDVITATYNVAATTNSFVGNYVISQTLNDPGSVLGNYSVVTNNGFLSVTPAALTVSANSTNRAVGQTNPIFTGTISGIQNNDNITATYVSTADTNSPTGLYDIIPQLQDSDGKLVNYSVTTNNGVLAVDGPPAIVVQPSNLIVGVGSNAVFTVTAAGGSLVYQWRKDGTNLVDGGNISGTTTTNLTLGPLSLADSATGYSVYISNSAGSITSSVVSVMVINPPSIIVAPQSRTNIAGTTATFNVVSGGDEPLHYQWRFDGVELQDEVFSSLSLLAVQATNAGNYTVVITNAVGAITSAPAVLNVHYSLAVTAGFGGTISKAPDESSYAPDTIVNLTATPDAGFVFTGWSGDASGMSNPLNVTMDTNKIIVANFMGPGGEIIIDNDDPAGRAEFEGFWFTLDYINPHYGVDYRYASPGTNLVTARATYRPEIVRPGNYDVYLFYPQRPILRTTNAQWVVAYNGGNVSLSLDQHTNGGRWFQIAAARPFTPGTHQFVRVSNNTGETETNAYVMADAVRFVYSAVQGTPPTFITHPQSQVLNQTSNATFTVQATGSGTLSYQWRFNDLPISGATDSSYTRTNLQATDAGNYSVVVMHAGGSGMSSNAVLSVNLPPTITAHPANKIVIAGKPVTFSVAATGTAPFAYQWQFNSNNIPGATNSSYTIANAFAPDAGSYSVLVSNVVSVVSSASALLTVTPDLNNPTISFVYPSIGGKVTNGIITVMGSAKDNVGVAEVKYVYEGVTNTASGIKPWSSVPLTLSPGTNVVVAWSIDLSGNESAKRTNRFYYNSTNLLVLNIVGNGQVSGLTNGQALLVGRPYSATAFIGAGTNYVFTNWTGSVTTTNKTVSFIMQSNMVLTANFISNPFSPVAGKYNGLFSEADGVRHESAGFFTITLSSKASYTGKLMMDGNTLPISGKFDLSGRTSRTVSRSKFGKSNLSLTLELDWSTTNETIHGTVSDGVWISDLDGDRAIFNSTFNPATNFLGRYTAIIPEPTNAPIDAPAGQGYLLITNNRSGVITISKGALADGAVLSQRVPMSKFGQWPLYVPTYKAITRYTNGVIVTTNMNEFRGALIGWLTFTNDPTRTLAGRVNWLKGELSPTNAYYASGFTSEADLIASGYTAPSTGARLLNHTNTTVVLADGNLVQRSTNIISIRTNNLVTTLITDVQFKLFFEPKNGLLRGTFAHPDNTNKITSFSGAVLQKQNYGGGAFLGIDESGSVYLGN